MADPFSLAASVAGIVSLASHVFHGLHSFRRQAAGAHSAVAELTTGTRNLSGILQNLSLLAASLEEESTSSGPGHQRPVSFKAQHLNACRHTLLRIEKRLKKAQDDFASGRKLKSISRSLKWPFSVEETRELLDEMAGHQRTLELALSADTFGKLLQCLAKQEVMDQSIKALRTTIERKFSIDTRIEWNKKRTTVIEFFLRINPQASFQTCLNLRQPMTGLWLTESNPTFWQWKDTPNSKIWLSGIPGAGKTILCGSVIEEVLQESSAQVAVAFYFCDYKNESSQQTTTILSVLGAQIAQQNDDAFTHLEMYYNDLHPEKGLSREPSTDDLLDVIKHMTASYDKVFLVIDGLDECGVNVRHVLHSLKSIIHTSPAVTAALFSRDEPEIREELAGDFGHIEIAAHTEDLELYVRAEMEKRKQLSNLAVKNPTLDEEIRRTLISGAKGMFRWVACQIDHLCELPTDRARRKALKELPPTLFETYDRILERLLTMPLETRIIIQKALHWIGLGENFTIEELCEAVSIPDGEDEMDVDDIADENEITSRCSSLVRKTNRGNQLEFAHFTVLEYLEGIEASSPLAFFRFSKKQAISTLVSTSFRFLTFPAFERRPIAIPAELKFLDERNSRHPFYPRAARLFLGKDMGVLEQETLTVLLEDASFFRRYVEKLFNPNKPGIFLSWLLEGSRWHRIIGEKKEKGVVTLVTCILRPEFTPLNVAAALSQPKICRFLLDRGVPVNSISELGSPLHFALGGPRMLSSASASSSVLALPWLYQGPPSSWFSKVESTISLLLDCGADSAQRWRSTSALAIAVGLSLRQGDIRGLLPFFRPDTAIPDDAIDEFENATSWRDDFQLELLQVVIDKVSQLGSSSNLSRLLPPIQRIAKRQHIDLPPLPPAMQYIAGMSDNDVLHAIKVSAEYDLSEDLEALLSYTRSSQRQWALRAGKTPLLHVAARNNSRRATAVLLDFGIDVNTTDDKQQTALHLCCERGHAETAKVLLERGARIDNESATAQGDTAWHIAARHNTPEVLSLLFQFDKQSVRNLAAVSTDGQTPLSCAIVSGAVGASQLLLDRCERPYNPDLFQSTLPLLHAAAETGNQELFCRLLDSGVSLPETSTDGSTPLHHLGPFCSKSFVDYMLSRYDHLIARDDGKIPLQLILLRLNNPQSGIGAVDAHLIRSCLPPSHTLPRAGTAPVIHFWEFFCTEIVAHFSIPCSSCGTFGAARIDSEFSDASSYLSSNTDEIEHDQEKERRQNLRCKRGVIWSAIDALIDCGVVTSFEATRKTSALIPLFSALLTRSSYADKDKDSIRCSWIVPVINRVMQASTHLWKEPRSPVHGDLLVRAIRQSEHQLVSVLLEYDPDVHSLISNESPIEAACSTADLITFRAVLQHVDKDRINEVSLQRRPLIHHVVFDSNFYKVEKTKDLLLHGADPNATFATRDKESIISLVAGRGQFGIVDLLVEFGGDIYNAEHNGFTVATAAATYGNVQLLKRLRSGEAPEGYFAKTFSMLFYDKLNRQWRPGKGCTLLHSAAAGSLGYTTQYLLDEDLGLSVNAISEHRVTPLHVATQRGNIEAVMALIERGANVNMRDARGWLPLDCAFDVRDREIARVLIEAGSEKTSIVQWLSLQRTVLEDLNKASGQRQRTFHTAFDLEAAIKTGNLNECKAIIVDEGCSIDAILPSCQGCPPLFSSVRANRPEIVSWLISMGANPDNVLCWGHRELFCGLAPLATHYLTSTKCLEQLLTYVLLRRIDVFNQPHNPLHVAAQNGNISFLLTIIAHIRSYAKEYRMITGFSPSGGKVPAEEQLLSHLLNQKKRPPVYTSRTANEPSISWTPQGDTPLHIAAGRGHIEAINILIENGADVNTVDEDGCSPLTISAKDGNVAIATLLIKAGGSVNHRDTTNYTPLMHAAQNGNLPMVELLHRMGADLSAADTEGGTALDCAANVDGEAVVFAYLASHCVLYKRDIYGVSPVERALRVPHLRSLIFNSDMLHADCENLEQLLPYSVTNINSSFVNKFCRALPTPVARRLVNLTPKLWLAPLCQAAAANDYASAEILLRHGAEIDLEGSPEGSPLMIACSFGRLDMVKFLVRAGAKLEYTNETGNYKNAFVSAQPHTHIIEWFLLGRFQEQSRLRFGPASEAAEVKPWAGIVPFEFHLPRELQQRWNQPMMDVLYQRQQFKKRMRGKVVK